MEPCQSPDSTCVLCMEGGGTRGATETWRSQRQLAASAPAAATSPSASAPFPWPRSRGDPALEKPPRQAPRLDAAKWETGKCHGSAKPKCENRVSRRQPRLCPRGWRGGRWGFAAERQGLRAGGGCWRLRELRSFKAVSAHSRQAWASQEWTVTSPPSPPPRPECSRFPREWAAFPPAPIALEGCYCLEIITFLQQ